MTEARLFSRHSIGTRIAALFMLLILVITGVMTYVSISVSTSELLDSSTDYTEQLILRVNAELDMYVEYMKDISDFIVDNGALSDHRKQNRQSRKQYRKFSQNLDLIRYRCESGILADTGTEFTQISNPHHLHQNPKVSLRISEILLQSPKLFQQTSRHPAHKRKYQNTQCETDQ